MLKVSASGYYAWRSRNLSDRARYHQFLIAKIQRIHQETKQSYGSVKTWKTLNAQGVRCGKHQVARLRKIHGIESKRRRRFKITTRSKNNKHVVPNRLDRQFYTPNPNKIWVGDVTFIATKAGWLYLAVMLDLYSRKVIGWSMSNRNDKQLALDALEMAIEQRNPGPGLLHHTDRGAIYSSDEYHDILLKKGCISSMSRPGDCYDNAVAESFFSSLKNEWIYKNTFESRNRARSEIFKYIEIFYNRQRIHQSLNYLTPEQFERQAVTQLNRPSNPG